MISTGFTKTDSVSAVDVSPISIVSGGCNWKLGILSIFLEAKSMKLV